MRPYFLLSVKLFGWKKREMINRRDQLNIYYR